MGSWDFIDDPDYDGPPIPHRIVCKSGWEGCQGSHEKLWQVKECFEAKARGAFVCGDIIWVWTEDGKVTGRCPRPRYLTDRGSECTGGHEYIDQQVRISEGWEYAEDEGEARNLAMAGVEPRTSDGKIWPA